MAGDLGKNWFFTSAEVLARVDAARRKALSRMGAFVRTRARSLLRYRKQGSAAGSPPSVHRHGGFARKTVKKDGTKVVRATSPLRELVFFAYDPGTDSVVAGPAVFRGASRKTSPAKGTVPGLIEGGGQAVWERKGRTITLRNRKRGGTFEVVSSGGRKVLRYAPRSFMAKALELERPKFAAGFNGAVGG